MLGIAFSLNVVFLVLAFGLRTVIQLRRTGDAGWRIASANSRAEATAHACLVLGATFLGVAPIVALVTDGEVASGLVAVVGATGGLAAIVLVTVAQLQMGASWRIGVDPTEHTPLITDGLYRWVRNPIYTGIALFAVSQLLLVPNLCMAAALLVSVVGIELQVRRVEEPYLRAVHGDAFSQWAETSGRFVPTWSNRTARAARSSGTPGPVR